MDNTALYDIAAGESAVISDVNINGAMRRRLQDLGFLCGAEVKCMFRAHSGEPAAFLVCGALIALREEEMKNISVVRKEQPELFVTE